jgi:hypothetical protein
MFRRIFNTLSVISALLLACTMALWVWSVWADPQEDSLSFSKDFHVGVFQGRLEFFNLKDGPYHGGIIALSSPESPAERIFAERRWFRDTLGV